MTFLPHAVTFELGDGESLFELARREGVPVDTACIGKGTCGLCRVKITSGEANLSPFTAEEKKHLGNVYFITKERLACQTFVQGGNVTVTVRATRK